MQAANNAENCRRAGALRQDLHNEPESSVLLPAIEKLDEPTILAIAVATAAESTSYARDKTAEGEAFAAIYGFLHAVCEVALVRRRHGVLV